MIIPTPAPRIVGQSVPDCGRVGAGVDGAGVPAQTQLVLEVQDGLRHIPLEHTRFDAQLALLPQVPPQELGVDTGVGVPVGVGVGVPAGVDVGVAVGVGVETDKVNEREQAGLGVGVFSAALGKLDGTFGATGCCLSW